jgi:hypothetical protein
MAGIFITGFVAGCIFTMGMVGLMRILINPPWKKELNKNPSLANKLTSVK